MDLYIVVVAVVVAFFLVVALFNRYRRCPSDKILVIYGTSAARGSAKCVHGGGAFVWPIIQDYAYMSLTPLSIDANLTNALSRQNIRVDGGTCSDPQFPDTDIPLFRLAEAYLTRAEAKWRSGDPTGIDDINVLRERANATPLTQLTEQDLIDEWCREFYMEGRRRSDLIRFDMFTGKSYLWAWKGGIAEGQAVDSHFKFYPIPMDDINNNKNMTQNPGY